MGKVDWNPQNLAKNWMNVCQGFQGLPFISQTLWQVGPMPWLMNFGNSSDWFPNGNWGQTTDSVEISTPVKDTAPKTEAEKKLEREQKEAENREQAFEKRQLTKKFDKLKPLLTEFQKTLNEDVREEFDLIKDIEKYTKSATKENYEKMLEIYNANKTKINAAKEKDVKKDLTSANNTEYTSKVTTLYERIEDLADSKFGILDDDKTLKDDIDIMELLSTWNSNTTTKNSHVMKTIGAKYKSATGENKSKYEVLVNALHDKLSTAAENIDEDKLTEETKKLLKDAQDKFEKFDTIAKRFPTSESECGVNYSNAFDNLYRAIRLAEAEIVEKDLKESFNFLGDENPYKTSTIVADTKTDLKNEFLSYVRTVTEPVAPSVPSGAKEVKVESTSYHIHTEGNTTKYYKADGTEMTEAEFKASVGEVVVKENGCYSITKDGTTKYYKADHTTTDETTFNATTVAETPTAGTTALADGSVKDAIGTQYNSWDKLYVVSTYSLDKILHNEHETFKFNRESVIGLIDHIDEICTDKKGIITRMRGLKFDKDNCNRVVKAVMRQALHIGLNAENCTAYKNLAEYFGAQGTPEYKKEDGYTPDNDSRNGKDTFEFTQNIGTAEKFTIEEAKQIDVMLTALINKIKDLNKAA